MRTNSTSLRLNYSSSWNNKIIPGRNYTENFCLSKSKVSSYLNKFFENEKLSKVLVNSKYKIYFYNNDTILINVYVYIFRYADRITFLKSSGTDYGIVNSFLFANWVRPFLKKISYIITKDLNNILRDIKKFIKLNFVLVEKRYFDASLASKYITNKLLNKFKLDKTVNDLKRDVIENKNKSGIIVYCSGRFDRKERASSQIYSDGKISLTTIKNKVTYNQNNVTLKYGICGIKVWVLK